MYTNFLENFFFKVKMIYLEIIVMKHIVMTDFYLIGFQMEQLNLSKLIRDSCGEGVWTTEGLEKTGRGIKVSEFF